jgi:hypothetical protein
MKREKRNLKHQIKIDHKGSLKKFGFSEQESEAKEKQAIRKANKEYGRQETDLKLAALEAFNKHKEKIREKIHSILKWNERN